jgi:ubiquitin-protein ligase
MDQAERATRLRMELQALEKLRDSSTIFDFEAIGAPADRYTITLHGKGLGRDSAQAEIGVIELHKIELRLPYTYPEQAPDVRWLTPLLHPNVSFSGFVNLPEIGLPWTEQITLDVLCERLWDVARAAYINADKAVNYSAKNWLAEDCPHSLPIDNRPLRDKLVANRSNVVHYERRGQSVQLPVGQPTGDVLFIDENTPAPAIPYPTPRHAPRRRRPSNDDDVMYIGPE